MDARVKKKWLRALRNRNVRRLKISQARNQLKKDSRRGVSPMCCLGVLCEIYRTEHPKSSRWAKNDFCIHEGKSFTADNSLLPRHVQIWAGLHSNNPIAYNHNDIPIFMTELNDEKKWSFKKIAKVIEQNL